MSSINKNKIQEMNEQITNYIDDLSMSNYKESKDLKEGRIHLDLTQTETIYNPYSGNSILDDSIYSFLDETYRLTKKSSLLSLDIEFPEDMTYEEQDKIKHLIRVHYAIEYKETKIEILKTKLKGWIILFLGSLLYLIYGLFVWYDFHFVFQGIAEIFSWVFIWEACHLFVFTNTQNRVHLLKSLKLFNALQ